MRITRKMFGLQWLCRHRCVMFTFWGLLCIVGMIQITSDLIIGSNWSSVHAAILQMSEPLLRSVHNITVQKPSCNYPWATPDGQLNLTNSQTDYFQTYRSIICFKGGTNFDKQPIIISNSTWLCPCLFGWNGKYCSIPDDVVHSNFPMNKLSLLKPRIKRPLRKIINAFPFNSEFEMLEARLAELHDVVDVFMILESNYTAFGKPKPLKLLDRLKAGYYKEYACKIVHVFLDFFPKEALQDGWIADSLLRDHIAKHGLVKQLINYRSDDVFVLNDADELPHKEAMWFLKLHDGYPEPVGINLQANVYGFFWRGGRKYVHVICAVSVGVLTRVLNNRAIHIRSADAHIGKNLAAFAAFAKSHNGLTYKQMWSFGTSEMPAGWHCSSCCSPDCIRDKLLSAQNGDFPRWGNYPDKVNTTYIMHLIKRGLWFDGKGQHMYSNATLPHYAPEYLLQNFEKYKHLLVNPYSDMYDKNIVDRVVDARYQKKAPIKTKTPPAKAIPVHANHPAVVKKPHTQKSPVVVKGQGLG